MIRRGAIYEQIQDLVQRRIISLDSWLDHGTVTNQDIAAILGVSDAIVSRSKAAFYSDREMIEDRRNFKVEASPRDMLGPPHELMAQLAKEDKEEFERMLDIAVDAFVAWRTKYFHMPSARPYITKDFHKKWIRNTLKVIYTGGRGLILSPPRHGKSELLVHFCVWLIVRFPDIRILWVGPNQEIAENMLGLVRSHLEENVELINDYLAPGETWKPRERGSLWARQKFTVQQQDYRIKQPTMWCVGVGGRILSMDCDFIIVDDPDDPDKAITQGGRVKTENWFKVKLATRKMMHTGLVMISSRVHMLDLYSNYVDMTDSWEVIVDKAHDISICGKHIEDFHDEHETDCILFPELNPWEYLVEQLDIVGKALFEMIYLNQPRPDSILIFNPDMIRERCCDPSRTIGVQGISEPYKLIAGLDPAARATQAAFLWAFGLNSGNTYMVDLETQHAGGVSGALRVMREWWTKYDNRIWIVEDNGYQKTFFDDPRVRGVSAELGLTVRPTHTGRVKHDKDFGVAAMEREYNEARINLPYGDRESIQKTDLLIKELTLFTGEGQRNRPNQSDILMAHWFPWSQVIKRWRVDMDGSIKTRSNVHQSFGGITQGFDGRQNAPWSHTTYLRQG